MAIRVFLAEGSEILSQAIRQLLEDRAEVEFVGEAANFSRTIEMASNLKPDVILIDLLMAEKEHRTSLDVGGAQILAMSLSDGDEARSLAETLGASLIVDKINLYDELIPAIVKLASNGHLPLACNV